MMEKKQDGNRTILIVDDEPATLKSLEVLLRKRYRTVTADSGEAALAKLQYEKVAILITDQRMPGIHGTELIRRARSIDPDITCMLMTANSDATTFIDAIRNSATRVISKPWNPDDILREVEAAIAKHDTHSENRRAISMLKKTNEKLNNISKR